LIARRWFLAAGLGLPWRRAECAETLLPRLEGNLLRASAPQLHFLTGKPLERLHNGASVAFNAQLSLSLERGSATIERSVERFVVSYDLWEEKFSASRLSQPPRSVSHLSAGAAEAWCLLNLMLPVTSLASDKSFWLRLELRAEDPRERPAVLGEPGISLTRLIELFSRPSRGGQPSWVLEDGPFRLADLIKARRSGSG